MKSFTSYFIGIPLPQKYLKEFNQLLNDIHKIDPSIETVHPQTPHITIYHLNKQSQDLLEEIHKNIKPFSDILKKVTLTIEGFDYFQDFRPCHSREGGNPAPSRHKSESPNFTKDNPKVFFLDIKYPKTLIDFRNKISEILEKYSAPDNNLPFHPHMTIGKVIDIHGQQNFNKTKNEIMARLDKIHWEFRINEIVLYGVDSTKSPEYQEKLFTIPIN